DEFADMQGLFPYRVVRTDNPTPLPMALAEIPLPETYEFAGLTRNLRRFLEETDTSGLLVLLDGRIVHEEYALGSSPETRWISWSVAKSFVSAMVGIALSEGLFESVREPITKYVPELTGSAYDAVAIEDILEMSSGASWDEDYGDLFSDITRFGSAIVFGYSQDEFAASLSREFEPGRYNRYNSTDTQVLGMLLVRLTGMTLAAYTEEKLWKPMQMEHDAYWITDEPGMELAFGGLNVTLRDYARFGEMYRNAGRWQGRQIVPESWVTLSTVPGKPHLQPGEQSGSDSILGYAYQWWRPPTGDEGEFSAIGVYNQFIYVNPAQGVVIAKTSANEAYGTDESTDREIETLAVFNVIAHAVRDHRL
ncbi:MAG: serine hydrolase, partial [Myxococcota bacterium]